MVVREERGVNERKERWEKGTKTDKKDGWRRGREREKERVRLREFERAMERDSERVGPCRVADGGSVCVCRRGSSG